MALDIAVTVRSGAFAFMGIEDNEKRVVAVFLCESSQCRSEMLGHVAKTSVDLDKLKDGSVGADIVCARCRQRGKAELESKGPAAMSDEMFLERLNARLSPKQSGHTDTP